MVGLVVFGCMVSTLTKLAYETEAQGRNGQVHAFEKPWFMVLLMFTGMSMCLPLALCLDLVRARGASKCARWAAARQAEADDVPALQPLLLYELDDQGTFQRPSSREGADTPGGRAAAYARKLDGAMLLITVPMLLDLLGSALLSVGLVFVSASAAAMLRQSLLLFATGLALTGWRAQLNRFHAAGLAACLAGLAAVCAASLMSGFGGFADAPTRARLCAGLGLVAASQLMQALQLVVDRRVLQHISLSPIRIVGCEGLLGMACTACIALPMLAHGPGREGWGLREDARDALEQVMHSPRLALLLVAHMWALQMYNLCGMALAGELDAVQLTMLQALRTSLVWALNLLLGAATGASRWYSGGGGAHPAAGLPLGEPWTAWSWLQGAGFALLVGASMLYSHGNGERLRRQLMEEALLLRLDAPLSVSLSRASSLLSGAAHATGGGPGPSPARRGFRAHMDIDTASFMRSVGSAPAPAAMHAAPIPAPVPVHGVRWYPPGRSGGGGHIAPAYSLLQAADNGGSVDSASEGGGDPSLTDSLVPESWPPWVLTPPASTLRTTLQGSAGYGGGT